MSDCYDLLKLYEVGLEGKRQKRRKGFELLWLPVLARKEVIRSMDVNEIIKLSMSSRRMEAMIRYTKVKSNKIGIHVNIKNSILQIESFNKNLYYCSPDQLKNGSNNFGSQILSRWIDKTSTSFQNCVSILKHLQNIISFKSLCLHVNLKGMTVPFFKEILTEPTLKDFEVLRLDKGKIDAECLDLVMEMAQSNRSLHIKGTKVPENYYHENAFKFHDIHYNNAEWVRIEHLFTLKDSYSVSLVSNQFTYQDLNTYIKYWIESDHDMVRKLVIGAGGVLQTESLFDGILALQGRRNRHTVYLVAANPTKQRKHQIMGVFLDSYRLHLFSFDKNEPIQLWGTGFAESWAPEYKVLMVMNKKEELERELEETRNFLITTQDQNMVKKKNEISEELQNVSKELDSYNLVFRDGFYSYT
ncbi:hypothetical protein CAEBREN_19016 [Caenorhabditis brenneri]|uniref:F-box domain-containing protein n=1 Tax=Caenorhabditis brenneri TaxID=135651 RepID=G0PAK7_CAEBE|nr:hypothetical protein CAEBREN_19016 [Caenorhabditis brenneri]